MAQQGKEYTQEQRDQVLERLKPYFLLGYSRNKACILGKFDGSTLSRWEKDDPELSRKIDSWIEYPTSIARQNIVKKLNSEDIDTSKWWLERRDKDMTPKQESTVKIADKETLENAFTELVQGKDTKDTETADKDN